MSKVLTELRFTKTWGCVGIKRAMWIAKSLKILDHT